LKSTAAIFAAAMFVGDRIQRLQLRWLARPLWVGLCYRDEDYDDDDDDDDNDCQFL